MNQERIQVDCSELFVYFFWRQLAIEWRVERLLRKKVGGSLQVYSGVNRKCGRFWELKPDLNNHIDLIICSKTTILCVNVMLFNIVNIVHYIQSFMKKCICGVSYHINYWPYFRTDQRIWTPQCCVLSWLQDTILSELFDKWPDFDFKHMLCVCSLLCFACELHCSAVYLLHEWTHCRSVISDDLFRILG